MIDKAATSFSGRIAKAGGRFLAEIAVSSIATLCVSLGLSNYLTRESPPALPSSPPSFMRLAAPLGGEISTMTSTLADWQFVAPASAHGEDLSSASSPQSAPVEPPTQSVPRPPARQARAKSHAPKPACSGECAAHLAAAHTQPAPAPTLAGVQPLPPSAQHATLLLPDDAADAPLPPLPIPEGAFDAQRLRVRPIARVANLLTNLVGRW